MPDDADKNDDEIPEMLARRFLPHPLPDHWLVLPKRLLQWAAVNIMLLGAAGGSLLTALVASFVPLDSLTWIVVGFLALIYLVRKFLLTPLGGEAVEEARKAMNLPA
jgi:uncharacterized membrane protein YfcA